MRFKTGDSISQNVINWWHWRRPERSSGPAFSPENAGGMHPSQTEGPSAPRLLSG